MSEWTDIGEQLKVTREKRKMSLEDISHEMRIPVATLRALEENDYSGFPSPSYAKRFLGQYAEFLNIDADDGGLVEDAYHGKARGLVPFRVHAIPLFLFVT